MAYEDEKKGELETLLNDILEDKNTNLTPENLKKGVTVLGVDGNYIGTDTSDATATNEDVLEGKTAYAQGQKLTGTLRVEDVDSVLDMFPSVETEISEEIDIKDAVENGFNDLSIYGNSKQESTTGKNLVYEIRSGYLTTVENQEATTTEGSEFGNWQINFKNKDGSTSISLEAGEYYVSLDLKINSGSVSNPLNLIAVSEKDGQETINNPVPTTKYQRYCFKSIFNSAKNVNNIIIQKHYDEEVCSFKIKNVMISTIDDYNYEPYTGGNPSPNPDYPQKINSVGRKSKNILDISDLYTESTINGVNVKYNNDGTLTLKGTSTSSIELSLRQAVPIEHGNYSYKCFGLPENIHTNIYYVGDVYGETVKNFTVSNDNNYGIVVRIPINTTIDAVIKPMLVKGTYDDTIFPEFEPYTENLIIKFKRIGKNYNKYPYFDSNQLSSGVNYEILENYTIQVTGSPTDLSFFDFQKNNLKSRLKLKKGTYTFSATGLQEGLQISIHITDKNGNNLERYYIYKDSQESKTVTFDNDIELYSFLHPQKVGYTFNTIVSFQIEKGTEATEYEPYHEDEYTINLNTDLNSINILSKQLEYNYVDEDGNKYLCDVIDFKNKKIIKYLNKIILPKENITWNQNKDETDFFEIANFYILNQYQARGDLAISNYFRDDRYKSNYIVTSKSTVFIRFPKSSGIDTLQKAQEFMDTHDVEVLYVLAKPKEIDLTDEELSYLEQFPLQKGTNYIYSDDELPPKFKLKYYRDINMMLESEIINNAESKFNIFYDSKVEEFNTNVDNKLEEYNTNATSKINEYDTNADEKLKGYNTNATNKINEYNTNADEKLEEFNSNATEKTTAYNDNADEKLEEYNTNAEDKLNEYNTNATNKINEYNTNAEAILKILPKTETEVLEEIDIDDAGESSFNKLKVFGNSRQGSTTGANKAIGNTYLNNSQYGDSLYLIGDIKPDTTYTVNLFVPNGNRYYLAEELIVGYKSLVGYGEYETISFTTKSDISSAIKEDKGFVFLKNLIVNPEENDFKNIMLVEGEYTEDTMPAYEPYTGGNPSPNPDYPQEIEAIGNNINLFDKDNTDMFLDGMIPDNYGLIQVGTTSTDSTNYIRTIIMKCKPNTSYAISRYVEGKTFFIYESDVYPVEGSQTTLLKRGNSTGKISEIITI